MVLPENLLTQTIDGLSERELLRAERTRSVSQHRDHASCILP
jgi:hypothetical protein